MVSCCSQVSACLHSLASLFLPCGPRDTAPVGARPSAMRLYDYLGRPVGPHWSNIDTYVLVHVNVKQFLGNRIEF
jgi:hypothetical protein